jgi:hypothetical protein
MLHRVRAVGLAVKQLRTVPRPSVPRRQKKQRKRVNAALHRDGLLEFNRTILYEGNFALKQSN